MFSNVSVADYDKWRQVFDAHEPARSAAGLTVLAVLRDTDNPNSVWVVGEGERAKFDDMIHDLEFRASNQQEGLTGPPESFWVP